MGLAFMLLLSYSQLLKFSMQPSGYDICMNAFISYEYRCWDEISLHACCTEYSLAVAGLVPRLWQTC